MITACGPATALAPVAGAAPTPGTDPAGFDAALAQATATSRDAGEPGAAVSVVQGVAEPAVPSVSVADLLRAAARALAGGEGASQTGAAVSDAGTAGALQSGLTAEALSAEARSGEARSGEAVADAAGQLAMVPTQAGPAEAAGTVALLVTAAAAGRAPTATDAAADRTPGTSTPSDAVSAAAPVSTSHSGGTDGSLAAPAPAVATHQPGVAAPAASTGTPAASTGTPAASSGAAATSAAAVSSDTTASATASAATAAESAITPATTSGATAATSATAATPTSAAVPTAEPVPAGTAPAVSTEPGPVLQAVAAPAAPSAASPAAPAQAATPAHVVQTEVPIAQQLSVRLGSLRTAPLGEHVLTMRVEPESIGPVRVVAHITAEGVRIELAGATDQAREALRVALPDLRRDLAATGLTADLDLADLSGQGFGRRDDADQAPTPRAPMAAAPTPERVPTPTSAGHAGGLDLEI